MDAGQQRCDMQSLKIDKFLTNPQSDVIRSISMDVFSLTYPISP